MLGLDPRGLRLPLQRRTDQSAPSNKHITSQTGHRPLPPNWTLLHHTPPSTFIDNGHSHSITVCPQIISSVSKTISVQMHGRPCKIHSIFAHSRFSEQKGTWGWKIQNFFIGAYHGFVPNFPTVYRTSDVLNRISDTIKIAFEIQDRAYTVSGVIDAVLDAAFTTLGVPVFGGRLALAWIFERILFDLRESACGVWAR